MSLDYLASIPGWEEFPLREPPPGVKANFVNPESNAYQVDILAGVCLALICFSAGIRFYVKAIFLKNRTRDDIPYLCAAVVTITYIILSTILFNSGAYGLHAWDVQLKELTISQIRLTIVLSSIYSPFIWLVKTPLFLLYLEIFGRLKWMRYLCWTAMVITGLFYLSSMISGIALCVPTTGYSQLDYLSAISAPQCAQNASLRIAQSVVNVGSDLFLLVLPLPSIWSLQLTFRKKLGISVLCLTGLLACVCSGIASWYRLKEVYQSFEDTDSTWDTTPFWLVTMLEMTCGIIVSSAPCISVLWKRSFVPFVSRIMTSTSPFRSTQKTAISGLATIDNKSESQHSYKHAHEIDSKHIYEMSDARKTTDVFVSEESYAAKPEDRREFV